MITVEVCLLKINEGRQGEIGFWGYLGDHDFNHVLGGKSRIPLVCMDPYHDVTPRFDKNFQCSKCGNAFVRGRL